jgi:nucleoside-specific outer membrane channel protein Tsx
MARKLIKKSILLFVLLMALTATCSANAIHDIQDSVEADKWGHFGMGYIIIDQLHKHTKLTPLERNLAVFCIAFAKEKWVDHKISKGDIIATVAGGLTWEIKF